MTDKEYTYNQIQKEYQHYLTYRDKIIKRGLVVLFTLPLFFMIMMFFLANKILFLGLWIISFIIIAFLLSFVDYKGYYYRKLLNLDNKNSLKENNSSKNEHSKESENEKYL